MHYGLRSFAVLAISIFLFVLGASAQGGNSGSIDGVVKDSSGGAISNATVQIKDVISGYARATTTGGDGSFRFTNVPFNGYHMTVTAKGFAAFAQDVEVRSAVPAKVEVNLKLGTEVTTVTVESNGADLLENEPTFHTDVDRNAFERTPLEGSSSIFIARNA